MSIAEGRKLGVPVLLVAFRRPACTRQALAGIRAAEPAHFRAAADYDGTQACLATREIIKKGVDWPCDFKADMPQSRMGLKCRVVSAIDWVLGEFDRVIVVEDDCVLHPSFFRFCEELLHRYQNDKRVMHISALNVLYGSGTNTSDSYYFSQRFHCWGWATWRRAWRHNDPGMSDWDAVIKSDLLRRTASHPRLAAHRHKNLTMIKAGKLATWDFQWGLSCLKRNGLAVIPRVNAVHNIGFGVGATHSRRRPPFARKALATGFPLRHPSEVEKNIGLERSSCRFL